MIDSSRLLTARNVLAGACALGVVWLPFAHVRREAAFAPTLPPSGGSGVSTFDARAEPSLQEALATVRDRDMFRQSVLYEVPKAEKLNLLGAYQYLGAIEQGGRRRAFIMNTATSQSALYDAGANLGDAKIVEILQEKVVVGHGDERLELLR